LIEIEKTYLAKFLPADLQKFPSKILVDVYLPKEDVHPKMRLRRRGTVLEMTKKQRVNENDASHQKEFTIPLNEREFAALEKLDGKRVAKIRYDYVFNGRNCEIDVFQEDLAGLVLVDFEFASLEEKDAFEMPEFCLADVTQEEFSAGGMVCGKTYADLESDLARFGYQKI
jgi:CYTH domain-containing protein